MLMLKRGAYTALAVQRGTLLIGNQCRPQSSRHSPLCRPPECFNHFNFEGSGRGYESQASTKSKGLVTSSTTRNPKIKNGWSASMKSLVSIGYGTRSVPATLKNSAVLHLPRSNSQRRIH